MSKFSEEYKYVQVPADFIENCLKANGAYVKVYLFILNLAAKGREMSPDGIAGELDLIESDVLKALEYWKETGAIKEEGERIVINAKIKAAPREEQTDKELKPEYNSMDISRRIASEGALSDMMSLAQDIFGRILTASEMESVFWFYDGLKFSPEAILLLLEYCVSKGKTSMKYIEKVAVSWSGRGANDAESVYEIIKEEEQRNGYLYSVRKVLGIADRALSQSEERYLMKWKNERGMSEEMVALAYEYCIIQTAKLSFPYMDKIIERWYKQGITDIAAAEEDNKTFRERKTEDTPKSSGYNDLESLTRGRMK